MSEASSAALVLQLNGGKRRKPNPASEFRNRPGEHSRGVEAVAHLVPHAQVAGSSTRSPRKAKVSAHRSRAEYGRAFDRRERREPKPLNSHTLWVERGGRVKGIKAFSETDFTDDLKAIGAPTLVMHGDVDQVVPIANSALRSAKLFRRSMLKACEKISLGMCTPHADLINEDLLAFIEE